MGFVTRFWRVLGLRGAGLAGGSLGARWALAGDGGPPPPVAELRPGADPPLALLGFWCGPVVALLGVCGGFALALLGCVGRCWDGRTGGALFRFGGVVSGGSYDAEGVFEEIWAGGFSVAGDDDLNVGGELLHGP